MVDFSQLLSTPTDQIKKVPPCPAGTYFGIIGGEPKAYELKESDKNKTPFVRYHVKLTEAGADVNQADLTEAGIDLAKKHMRKDFFLTPDAQYRLKDFVASCGVSVAGKTLGQIIPEAVGQRVMLTLTLRPSQDGKELFNDIAEIKGA